MQLSKPPRKPFSKVEPGNRAEDSPGSLAQDSKNSSGAELKASPVPRPGRMPPAASRTIPWAPQVPKPAQLRNRGVVMACACRDDRSNPSVAGSFDIAFFVISENGPQHSIRNRNETPIPAYNIAISSTTRRADFGTVGRKQLEALDIFTSIKYRKHRSGDSAKRFRGSTSRAIYRSSGPRHLCGVW